MAPIKSQNSNMLLAFLTLLGVIAIVAVVGFFMLRKGPEIIQGQAEVTEYRVSSKVPGRILEFRVKEGQSVNAGDTLAILEAPDVVAKMHIICFTFLCSLVLYIHILNYELQNLIIRKGSISLFCKISFSPLY